MISKHIFTKLISNNSLFYLNKAFNSSATLKPSLDYKQKLQLIKKQPWFVEYQTAIKYSAQNNFTDALKYYYKVINLMQQKNQKGQAYYYKIYQKIIQLTISLNRPLQAQQNFYKLIKVKKTLQKNPILVYEDYQNLLIHQFNHNVQKGIKLGKALLSESQINNLPISNQKYIRMLLGNCYLLVDNFSDAKKKYGEVLEMKPNHQLKAITLNNLSIACWWHKNPLFKLNQNIAQTDYQQSRINRDFKQTKQMLLNSIGSFQNIEQIPQKQAINLQNLLNQNLQNMLSYSSSIKNAQGKGSNQAQGQYIFQSEQSLKPIYNLIQYYIYNDPIQKPLILAWMRIYLKFAGKFNLSCQIDEITSKYYLLNNQFKQLQGFLNNLLNQYKNNQANKNKQSQQNYKNSKQRQILLSQIYKMKNLLNRVNPGVSSQQKQKSQKLSINLQKQLLQKDAYIFKRKFIANIQMSIMKNNQKL